MTLVSRRAPFFFVVVGEPDVKITKVKDGKLTVEIRGVDVCDPTMGETRSFSTDVGFMRRCQVMLAPPID